MKVSFPDLAEKKILVTGAMRGIGRELVRSLAQQRAHVVFNYRGKEEEANRLREELLTAGASGVSSLLFDVTDTGKMQESLDQFLKTQGPLQGLVNNAGISKDQLALRLKSEDLTQVLDVNLKSTILLTAFLARSFLKTGNVSVVNVGSVVGLMGNPSQIAYAASKAGVIGFTKSFAKEMSSKNVRCNVICPGFIQTDMTDALNPQVKEKYLDAIPLQRFGRAQEVANLVCFLLSDASSYITGEVIKIDGGLYI